MVAKSKKNPKTMTEAQAQELADWLERGEFEVGEPLPRDEWPAIAGRGRPSLTGKAEHSPQVAFRVPPALRDAAAARADEEGVTVSTLARRALEAYLRAAHEAGAEIVGRNIVRNAGPRETVGSKRARVDFTGRSRSSNPR